MTHVYNCTWHDATGYTPYYLMFGRHPSIQVDLVFETSTSNNQRGCSEYVQTLHDCLSGVYAQANLTSQNSKKQQKYYDQNMKDQAFSPETGCWTKYVISRGGRSLGTSGSHIHILWWRSNLKYQCMRCNQRMVVHSVYVYPSRGCKWTELI